MADLGVIKLGNYSATNSTVTGTTGTQPVLDDMTTPVDGSYVYDASNGNTSPVDAWFPLDAMPTDFGDMATLSLQIRYHRPAYDALKTVSSIVAQVFDGDGSATNLTDEITLATTVTTTTATDSSVVGFGTVTGSNKTTWDGAWLRIRINQSKTKGGSTDEVRITAAEFTGTYNAAAAGHDFDMTGEVIASTATVYNPTITPGAADIDLTGEAIASTATVPTPAITPGPVDIDLTGQVIASTATVPNPTIASVSNIDLTGEAIASTATVPNPTVTPGSVDVDLTGQIISDGTTVYNPTINPGSVDVDLTGEVIASTATVPNPTITSTVDIPGVVIASTESVPNPTITPGSVDIDLTGEVIASTATVPTGLTLSTGGSAIDIDLTGQVIASTATVYNAEIYAPPAPPTTYTWSSNGDSNGILYNLGDKHKSETWVNPLTSRNVAVRCSSYQSTNYPNNVGDLTTSAYWDSDTSAGNWIEFEFPEGISVTDYTVRNINSTSHIIRNWDVEGSNDGTSWTEIDSRTSDATITSAEQWGHFTSLSGDTTTKFRYIRVISTGLNSSSQDYFRFASIEFYGEREAPTMAPKGFIPCRTRSTSSAADTNGIFYQIGSDFGESSWSNPVDGSTIVGTQYASPGGTIANITNTTTGTRYSSDDYTANQWVKWDFGADTSVYIQGWSFLAGVRTFQQVKVQGSNNDSDWTDICTHNLTDEFEFGSYAIYLVADDPTDTTPYRYIRVLQEANVIDDDYYSVDMIEFYGGVSTSVYDPNQKALEYDHYGDQNGLLYWLGKLEGATPTWSNPVDNRSLDIRVKSVSGTSVNNFPSRFAERTGTPGTFTRYISDDVSGQYIIFRLPGKMRLDGYTITNSFDGQNTLRNWDVEGYDPTAATPSWVLLDTHTSDTTLSGSGVTAFFTPTEGDTGYYQYIRLSQTGLNSSSNDYIVIDEIELYGDWKGLDILNPVPEGLADCRYRTDNDPSTDTGGIFYYVGTDAKTTTYSNPLATTGGAITSSAFTNTSTSDNPGEHDLNSGTGRYLSSNSISQWLKFDFDNGGGEQVILTGFAYYPSYDFSHRWEEGDIQGSNNDSDWTDLMVYDGSGTEKAWGTASTDYVQFHSMDDITDATKYRYIRFRQTGQNTNSTNYFSANHVEFYGYYGSDALAIDLDGQVISSTATVNNPTVGATTDIDLTGQAISDGTTVYNPTIVPGSVDIDLTGQVISSTATVNNPTVRETGIFYAVGNGAAATRRGMVGWNTSGTADYTRGVDKLIDEHSTYSSTSYWYSDDTASSWVEFDFGVDVQVNSYGIISPNDGNYLLRNWKLQGYDPNAATPAWVDLDTRTSDTTFTVGEQYEVFTNNQGNNGNYRYYRILQTGVNADASDVLAMEQIEFFGTHPGFSGLTSTLSQTCLSKDDALGTETGGIFYEAGTDFGLSSWTNPADNTRVFHWYSASYLGRIGTYATDRVLNASSNSWTSDIDVNNYIKWDFAYGQSWAVNIRGVALRSHPTLNETLEDFIIQGSNNDSDWTDIITVPAGRDLDVDEEDIFFWADDVDNTDTYRYIRYIHPGSARIRMEEIELYGFIGEQALNIDLDGKVISDGTTVYNPTITPGSVDIPGVVIASTATVPTGLTLSAASAPIDIDLTGQVIASTATVYNPTVVPGTVDIPSVIIASTTTVNNPTITPGAVDIDLTGQVIASTATVNNPTVAPGSVAIDLTGEIISDGTTVYNPTITPGTVDIDLTGEVIASTATVPTGLTFGATADIDLTGEIIPDGTTVYNPTITPGSVDIPGVVIASTATVPTGLSLTASGAAQDIDLTGEIISDGTTVYNPTITPGSVDIPGTVIASTATVFTGLTLGSTVDIPATVISSTENVPNPTLTPGAVDVDLTGEIISDGTTVYNPTIVPGAADIPGVIIASTATVPSGLSINVTTLIDLDGQVISSTATVPNPTITPGSVDIDLTGEIISDGTTVYNPTITGAVELDLTGQIISSTSTVPSGLTLNATTVIDLTGQIIPDGTTVYNPAIIPGAVDIDPAVIDSTATVYAPSVDVPAVSISPVRIESTATVNAPGISVGLRPIRVESESVVFAPTVAGTNAEINLSGQIITSTAQVFTPEFVLGTIISVLVSQQIDIKTINQIINVLTKDQTINALETGQTSEAGTSSTDVIE